MPTRCFALDCSLVLVASLAAVVGCSGASTAGSGQAPTASTSASAVASAVPSGSTAPLASSTPARKAKYLSIDVPTIPAGALGLADAAGFVKEADASMKALLMRAGAACEEAETDSALLESSPAAGTTFETDKRVLELSVTCIRGMDVWHFVNLHGVLTASRSEGIMSEEFTPGTEMSIRWPSLNSASISAQDIVFKSERENALTVETRVTIEGAKPQADRLVKYFEAERERVKVAMDAFPGLDATVENLRKACRAIESGSQPTASPAAGTELAKDARVLDITGYCTVGLRNGAPATDVPRLHPDLPRTPDSGPIKGNARFDDKLVTFSRLTKSVTLSVEIPTKKGAGHLLLMAVPSAVPEK